MKVWHDKIELLAKVAQARRDAYETSPRTDNWHVEAAMFIAMLRAVDEHYADEPQPSPGGEATLTVAAPDDGAVVHDDGSVTQPVMVLPEPEAETTAHVPITGHTPPLPPVDYDEDL